MKTLNTASWTRDRTGGWAIIVEFHRHWEAPKVGSGLGSRHTVEVSKKGDYRTTTTTVELTSRVFNKNGTLKAFAQEV